MNTIFSFFFKSWTRSVLTLLVTGAVLIAVQQGISQHTRPAVQSAPHTPVQETRALPYPTAAEPELPPLEIPVAATPKRSSSASAGANVVAPVSAPAATPVAGAPVSGQIVVPRLARAVKAEPNNSDNNLVSVGSPGPRTMNPPLAFTVDPKTLTPAQQTALANIQNQFLQATDDPVQDPADPVYQKRWKNAQSISDEIYKATFGWGAFEAMQLHRAKNSYTEIQM